MRIQHNIMAMNAYRNYNNNTSALAKNLERLSSGYKINRAGDDAAGLAISEKMRAQITGLEAAQKNVKDGTSLVNTAEGAMQEIQDMLNRMVYLATQSSNGTYDNEVDRKNLQAEVDQLRSEIDRIADSANFNGIKLLDGSLETGFDATEYNSDIAAWVGEDLNASATVGTGTIVHNQALPQQETQFNVDFGNSVFTIGAAADDNKTVTLDIGGKKFSVTQQMIKAQDPTLAEGDQADAATIVKAFLAEYGDGKTSAGDVEFGNQAFKMSAGTAGNQLTFTQVAKPTKDTEVVDGHMSVKITGVTGGGAVDAPAATVDVTPVVKTADPGSASAPATASVEMTFDPSKVQTIELGGKKFVINPAPNTATAAAGDLFETDDQTTYTMTRTATTTDAEILKEIADTVQKVTIGGGDFKVEAEGTTLKFTAIGADGNPVNGVAQDAAGTDYTADTFKTAVEGIVKSTAASGSDAEDPASPLGTITATPGTDGKQRLVGDFATELSAIDDNVSGGNVTIGSTTYSWGSDSSGTALTGSDADTLKSDLKSKIEAAIKTGSYSGYAASWEGGKVTLTAASAGATTDGDTVTLAGKTFDNTNGVASASAGKAELTISTKNLKEGDTLTVDGNDVTITAEMLADATKLATALAAVSSSNYTISATGNAADGTVAITLTEASGKEGANDEAALKAAVSYKAADASGSGSGSAGAASLAAANGPIPAYDPNAPAVAAVTQADAEGANADYNASTEVIQQGAAPGSNRLASTYMDIKEIKDGSALKVGDKTYVFAVGSDSKVTNGGNANTVVVDMKAWKGAETDFLDNALDKLTKVAEEDGNTMFSIGYQGNGRVTFTEQETYQGSAGGNPVDLSTRDAIAKQFGYAVDGQKTGSALNLQIGDTSDTYNTLGVDIKDMHVESLGIADIDISNPEGAHAAIDKIKAAINTVSAVRGNLGAISNRLDHTANNLSVMAENITDAESTIRDTDIAEEMMAYTKNNILVQSAQAMLAQANQVPQGVLQLLQ